MKYFTKEFSLGNAGNVTKRTVIYTAHDFGKKEASSTVSPGTNDVFGSPANRREKRGSMFDDTNSYMNSDNSGQMRQDDLMMSEPRHDLRARVMAEIIRYSMLTASVCCLDFQV